MGLLSKWIPKNIKKIKIKKGTIIKKISKAGLQAGVVLGSGLVLSKILDNAEISQDQTRVINVHSEGINLMEFAFLGGMLALALEVGTFIFTKVRGALASICKKRRRTRCRYQMETTMDMEMRYMYKESGDDRRNSKEEISQEEGTVEVT